MVANSEPLCPATWYPGVVCTQHSPHSHLGCTPLRGPSHCGISGDQRLKLKHVCLLSLAGLPCCWTPGDSGDPWTRGNPAVLPVLLPAVCSLDLYTRCHGCTSAFAVLADLQRSTVAFSIITSSLVKERGRPCEPRGETKKKPRSWFL